MKWLNHSLSVRLVLLAAVLGACTSTSASPTSLTTSLTVIPPTFTQAPMITFTAESTATVTTTFTPEPTPTATITPSPTPLPGTLVLPLETLDNAIPWLPMDNSARLSVNFIAFNMHLPPFNSAIVRQAFAYAIDRAPLIEMAKRYGVDSATSATTLTPPDTLGRDLYGEVGISFDPEKARDLLTRAGYPDPSAFPDTIFLVSGYGTYPGARFNIATAMVEMWKTHLGVTVEIEVVGGGWQQYYDRLASNPSELFWFGWAADYNDPDNFLRELFHSVSEPVGGFTNSEFDNLVDRAVSGESPAERQQLYIQAEQLLCEIEVAVIPLYHS